MHRTLKTLTILLTLMGTVPSCGHAEPSAESGAASVPERRLVPGEIHRYAFSWAVESAAENALLEDLPTQGGLALAGELRLRVHGESDAGTLLGVAFASLDEHRVEVMGQDVLEDASALLDREAVLLIAHDGEARRVFFDPEAPSIFRRLMLGLLAHTDLRLPSADGRSRSIAATGNGLAEVDYAPTDGRVFSRRLHRYVRFDAAPGFPSDAQLHTEGEGRLELGDDGMPVRIASDELLVLAHEEAGMRFGTRTRVELARRSVEAGEDTRAPDLEGWIEQDLHDPPDHAESERELARKFAEGLTIDDLGTVVKSAGHGLRPSPGLLVRARGLLRGWPELAAELAPAFDEAPDHRTRAFVLDLLVSADTPQAQEVIATILGRTPPVEELPMLVQHLALLRTPTPRTAALLLDLLERAQSAEDDALRRAVLYPMGAVTRELAEPEPELAARMLVAIRQALSEARTPEDRSAAIAGLGNAGAPEDLPRIVAHADDTDVDVRVDVVTALRFFDDATADDVIFSALGDADRMVGAAALGVVESYRPDARAVEHLALRVISAEHRSDLNGPIINVLAKRWSDHPSAVLALEAIERRTDDPHERLRIRRLLGRA